MPLADVVGLILVVLWMSSAATCWMILRNGVVTRAIRQTYLWSVLAAITVLGLDLWFFVDPLFFSPLYSPLRKLLGRGLQVIGLFLTLWGLWRLGKQQGVIAGGRC